MTAENTKSMRVAMASNEQIILRDGRPFGDEGSFGGDALSWPQPQTLAGAMRSALGFERDAQYFENAKNAEKVLSIRIEKLLPLRRSPKSSEWLAPLPADVIFTDSENSDTLKANLLSFPEAAKNGMTDIKNADWIIPELATREKEAARKPFLLHWSAMEAYLNGKLSGEKRLFEWGIADLPADNRIHNGLERKTLTTEEGRLFMNRGLYLKNEQENSVEDILITMTLSGLEREDSRPQGAYLGADRGVVNIEECRESYPACPDIFAGKRFLKLVLVTPGDFGGWAPSWLEADLSAENSKWVQIPDTDIEVRLRSAVVSGWHGISGWDYAKKGPKATRKLVNAGSVYVLEVKQPEQAPDAAKYFWGQSLNCGDTRSDRDGYSQVLAGIVQ